MKRHTSSVLLSFSLFIFLTSSCDVLAGNTLPGSEVNTQISTADLVNQWAVSASASSEFDNPRWGASQAVGVPDVLECGDNRKAWASRDGNTIEWIELTYATPVYPTEINIYQNYNPSQVVEVQMIGTDGSKYIAWEGYAEKVTICPDRMTVIVDAFRKVKIAKLRITIDQRVSGWGWNEIDAVELVGATK